MCKSNKESIEIIFCLLSFFGYSIWISFLNLFFIIWVQLTSICALMDGLCGSCYDDGPNLVENASSCYTLCLNSVSKEC